jgi:enediyne biosynthesis protein E3
MDPAILLAADKDHLMGTIVIEFAVISLLRSRVYNYFGTWKTRAMKTVTSFLSSCRSLIEHQRARYLAAKLPGRQSEIAQQVGFLFVEGYNAGLETDACRLAKQLDALPAVERSVMYEGAFCALAALDLTDSDPSMTRVAELAGTSPDLAAAINYGVGGALSHLGVNAPPELSLTNEFWSWPAIDSYGCHMGLFRWAEIMISTGYPPGIIGLGRRAFDQGLGRAIWFLAGTYPALIGEMVQNFAEHRRADLWSGIGIMTGMYGAEAEKDLRKLTNIAKRFRSQLQVGISIGAYVRHSIKSSSEFTDSACKVICHASSKEMAEIATACMVDSTHYFDRTVFDQWQKSIARTLLNS